MKIENYACNGCGVIKKEANHWWVALRFRDNPRAPLQLYRWADRVHANEETTETAHLCGHACVIKHVSEFMGEPGAGWKTGGGAFQPCQTTCGQCGADITGTDHRGKCPGRPCPCGCAYPDHFKADRRALDSLASAREWLDKASDIVDELLPRFPDFSGLDR